MMTSASCSASALTVAPAAVNSESGRPDLVPAPGSTATSTPSALNFFTVSGDAATRGSAGSISLATAIFIKPPAPFQGTRASGCAVAGASSQSGQKNRHQGEDHNDGAGAVFHQLDKPFIGLLVRGVVVALGGRVSHLGMISHRSLQRELKQLPWN